MIKEEMIALKKQLLNEGKILSGLFVVFVIVFKIVFFKESFLVVLKMVLSLFWLFVLPGFAVMLYWSDKLDFLERFVIGTALGLGVVGVMSYYIGLIGVNVNYHHMIFPILIIGLMGFVLRKKLF